jgi:hypothetical protein
MQAIKFNAGDCQNRKGLNGGNCLILAYYPNNLLERGRKTMVKDSAVRTGYVASLKTVNRIT